MNYHKFRTDNSGLLRRDIVLLEKWFPVTLEDHRAFVRMGQAFLGLGTPEGEGITVLQNVVSH